MAEYVKLDDSLKRTVKSMLAFGREMGVRGGPVRGALFAATRVIREEAKLLAPKDTGNLAANVYAHRDRNPRAKGAVERYSISVRTGGRRRRSRLGPQRRSPLATLTRSGAWYWHFVEFGTSKQPAQPFLRPAFENKKREAVQVFQRELIKQVEKVEAKARKAGGFR